jgi:hypothetical protein
MNDSNLFGDENRKIESRPPLGEDLLPPVEQPSARFIIQLFVVPALIVLLIVAVWISLSWLVRSTSLGPDKLIDGIEDGPSVARWQRASELADLLANKRYADFKRDRAAAAHLARILDSEIDRSKSGDDGQEQATLRYFLALALGQFETPDGLDVLLKASETKNQQNVKLVRIGAIKAIATRAYNLYQLDPPEELENPDLLPTLKRLASDEDPQIRQATAFALGQIASADALKQLETMTEDPDPDTRYNAAVGLAQHGNAKGIDTLAEMLDLDEVTSVNKEESDADRQFKRTLLIGSAIGAAHSLVKQNPKADLSPVTKALERIVKADPATLKKSHIDPHLTADAAHSLQLLRAGK